MRAFGPGLLGRRLLACGWPPPELRALAAAAPPCVPRRRMQQFIREHYGHTWLVWSHDAVHPDEEVAEEDKGWGGHARQGGGFTLRRKYPDAPSKPRHASPTGARMYNR